MLIQTAFELRPTGIVAELPQDNFKSIISKIKALDILVARRFKGPKPLGHPGLNMRQAVIASGQNRAEPDGADPTETEPMPVAMSGKMLVNQRRQFHPFHLFDEQRNVVDAFGGNVLDIIHAQSLAQSSI